MSNWVTDHSCGLETENLRTGCEVWTQKKKKKQYQKYSGQFFCRCLHNRGIYQINQKANKLYMDGLFYANRLEGYGQIIYPNGRLFEGLFKQHQRFGPGIVTYPDETQDVGLWVGFSLMRLSTVVAVNYVQQLGKTLQGQALLLKFRTLVPIYEKPVDRAKELLESLGASEEVLENSAKLYNLKVRNPQSLFFNKNQFDATFFTEDEDCTIEMIESPKESETSIQIEKFEFPLQSEPQGSDEEEALEVEEEKTSEASETKTFTKSCACLGLTEDYFTQICVQLHDVQAKLIQLKEKHKTYEEQEAEQLLPQSDPGTTSNSFYYNPTSNTFVGIGVSSNDLGDATELFNKTSMEEIETKNVPETDEVLLSLRHFDEEKLSSITLPFSMHQNLSIQTGDDNDSRIRALNDDIKWHDSETEITQKANSNPKLIQLNNDIAFYQTIELNLKKKLDREYKLNQIEEEEHKQIKKVKVTDLLAWNNEPLWTSMLRHCFKHRKSQHHVHFNVTDILAGQRNNFKVPGVYENNCRQFLNDCFDGHDRDAFSSLRKNDINPDLCDAHGNTGLMLASISDRTNVIEMLVVIGGKIDTINDEGLSPLTMALLRLLTLQLGISDWEKAFLKAPQLSEKDRQELKQWCPNKFLLRFKAPIEVEKVVRTSEPSSAIDLKRKSIDACITSSKFKSQDEISQLNEKLAARFDVSNHVIIPNNFFRASSQDYVFKTDFVKCPKPKEVVEKKKKGKKGKKDKKTKAKKSKKNKKSTKSKSTKSTASTLSDKKSKVDEEQEAKANMIEQKLQLIAKTINVLLKHKADTNLGQVPMQPIFLAVFTNKSEIVEMLLKADANPNLLLDDGATCLHVLVSRHQPLTEETVKMAIHLLKHQANANLRTNAKHWPEVAQELIKTFWQKPENDNIELELYPGKNPLQLLSLREDFNQENEDVVKDLVKVLISNGCNPNDLYLGHTPLSLAIVRGNFVLMKSLLNVGVVDAYQQLGNEMGNILTCLFLKRCIEVWGWIERKKIIELLLEVGFNPLAPIGEHFDNCIHFFESEKTRAIDNRVKSKKDKKSKKGKSKKQKKSKSKSKSSKSSKSKNDSDKKLAELEKQIAAKCRTNLRRHFQCQAVYYLYLFVMENLFFDPLIAALAQFINVSEALHCIKLLFQFGLIELPSFSYIVVCDLIEFIALQNSEAFDRDFIEMTIGEMSFLELKCPRLLHFPSPEIDPNENHYRICYSCLQKHDRQLKKCPHCELVYFCSEKCNSSQMIGHKCALNFYTVQEHEPKRLELLLELINKCKTERLFVFQMRELEMKLNEMKFKPFTLVRKMRTLRAKVAALKMEREEFAESHHLLEYSVRSEVCKSSEETQTVYSMDVSKEVNSTTFRRKAAPREKFQFLSNETIAKKLRMVPKLHSRISKLPLIIGDHICGRINPPIFTQLVQEVKLLDQDIKIVNKRYYIELLSKVFADFNLPLMLLPYACYKDGQIYYTMYDNVHFRKSFQRLNIPD